MLKRLAPLAIAGTVGFLLASLLNGGTPASAVSKTSDQVKLVNYTACVNSLNWNWIYPSGSWNDSVQVYIKQCSTFLK